MAQIYLPYNHIVELEFLTIPNSDSKKWVNLLTTINMSTISELARKHSSVNIDNIGYRIERNRLVVLPNTRYLNELFIIIGAYEKALVEILEENNIKGKLTISKSYDN